MPSPPGLSILQDMSSSAGRPEDLTHEQTRELRAAFEDESGWGLWLFARIICDCRELTTHLHLEECMFLSQWGLIELADGRKERRHPTGADQVVDSWRRLMMCVPRDTFKCQSPDDTLHTPTGPRCIGDLELGDEVCSPGGGLNRVVGNSRARAPLFRFVLDTGVSFTATPNHPLLTLHGWRTVETLEVGTPVAASREIPAPTPVGPWPYWAGVLCGDGHLPRRGARRGTPRLYLNDPEVPETLERLGVKVRRLAGAGYRVGSFSFLVDQWSLLPDSLWANSHHKDIPEAYEGSPDFLRGLFDTDGHVSGQAILYTTVSEALARSVQRNLRYFGVVSRLWFGHGHWRVSIGDPLSYWNFRSRVGFEIHRKSAALDSLCARAHRRTSSRIDGLPPSWREFLPRGLNLRRLGIRVDNPYWTSKAKAREALRQAGSDLSGWPLQAASDALVWLPIRSIEPLGRQEIAQLELSGDHLYWSEGVIQHNTTLGTRALSLWMATKDPEVTVGIFNESEAKVKDWIGAIKTVVERSRLYHILWPERLPPGVHFQTDRTIPRSWKWGDSGLMFPRESRNVSELTFEPFGIGGSSAGKHFTHKIYDDIIGEKSAQSEAVMQDAIHFVDHGRAIERPSDSGCELVNFTRWAYFDVYSHMLQKWPNDYKVYHRSLLENPETREPDVVNGESIFPERFPTSLCKKMYEDDPYVFYSQRQCIPRAGRETTFNKDWILRFTVRDLDRDRIQLAIHPDHYNPDRVHTDLAGLQRAPRWVNLSWLSKAILVDPSPTRKSEKTAEPRARNGIVAVGLDPWGRRFALESVPLRADPVDVLETILDMARRWAIDLIGIEEVNFSAVYAPLWGEIVKSRYPSLQVNWAPLKPQNQDKDARIRGLLGPHREGLWYYNLVGTDHLIQELLEYPHSGTRDLVDAQAYTDRLLSRPPTPDEQFAVRHRDSVDDLARSPYTNY